MKRNFSCPCGNNISVDIQEEFNLDNNPETIDEILNGSFMSFNCSVCNKIHKPEFPVMLTWKSKNLLLEILPELQRFEFYNRKKEPPKASVLKTETIISYREMAERISIIKDDLEPVVIEALKSFLLAKAEENYSDKEINAWYNGLTDGASGIEFHLEGIKEDETAVMRVPMEIYKRTLTQYNKTPKDEIFSSLRYRSYLSVQNLFRPEIFNNK